LQGYTERAVPTSLARTNHRSHRFIHDSFFYHPMKTAFKKTLALFVLAAFAAPTLSFAAAEYPSNQKRPAYSKTHKHHKHQKKAPAQ
jgi:hypothetical protein